MMKIDSIEEISGIFLIKAGGVTYSKLDWHETLKFITSIWMKEHRPNDILLDITVEYISDIQTPDEAPIKPVGFFDPKIIDIVHNTEINMISEINMLSMDTMHQVVNAWIKDKLETIQTGNDVRLQKLLDYKDTVGSFRKALFNRINSLMNDWS